MPTSFGVFEFLNATVSLFASEGKTDEVKEFTITERTVKVCLLHFRLEHLFNYINFDISLITLNLIKMYTV